MKRERLFCPNCGWSNIRSSKEAGFVDRAAKLVLFAPLRCRKCRLRFYRPWFVAKRASPIVTAHRHAVLASAEVPNVRPPTPAPIAPRRIILLLDEDPALRKLFRRLLDKRGYEVREVIDTRSALAELREPGIILAIVNPISSDDGEAAARMLRRANPKLMIIVLSETRAFPEKSERLLILPKPSSVFAVIDAVRNVPSQYWLRGELCG